MVAIRMIPIRVAQSREYHGPRKTEQTMLKVQKNNETLKTLKIQNAQMTYELVGLDRLSTVESMLEGMDSKVKAPTKPADILK